MPLGRLPLSPSVGEKTALATPPTVVTTVSAFVSGSAQADAGLHVHVASHVCLWNVPAAQPGPEYCVAPGSHAPVAS
jgi:hypothetical protein